MTQYNTSNIKLSNSYSNKLKSGIKNGAQLTSNLSMIIIGNDETNFPYKLI